MVFFTALFLKNRVLWKMIFCGEKEPSKFTTDAESAKLLINCVFVMLTEAFYKMFKAPP